MKQTILITGATSGFGQACAELFATRGWRLIVRGRREERLPEAEIVYRVTSVPPHVNINSLEARPVCQSRAPFAIRRRQQTELTACDG